MPTPEKNREYQQNWKKKQEKSKLRGMWKNQSRKWREENKEEWNEYFKNKFSDWLSHIHNKYSHACRCYARQKYIKTGVWNKMMSEDKSLDHILPVRLLGIFFRKKGLLNFEDKAIWNTLIKIGNTDFNCRFIKKEKNTRSIN